MPLNFLNFRADQYNGFTLLSLQSRYFFDIFRLFICRSYPSQTRRKYYTYYINYFTGSGFAYARDKLHSSRTSNQFHFYRPQTKFSKLCFHRCCLSTGGVSVQGNFCLGGSLSRGVSVQRGISVQGVSVQGTSAHGVSVQMISVRGYLCPEGSLFRGICVQRVSVQGVSVRETPIE